MPSWSEKLKTKRFRPKAELSVSACWGQSPNPNDWRFHLRRCPWWRLFFFLLALALRRASDIFNAEQPGQISLMSQQLPVLIFRSVVFRVCILFHRQQFGVLRPKRFHRGKLLLVGTDVFAESVRRKQFVKCPLERFAELDRWIPAKKVDKYDIIKDTKRRNKNVNKEKSQIHQRIQTNHHQSIPFRQNLFPNQSRIRHLSQRSRQSPKLKLTMILS